MKRGAIVLVGIILAVMAVKQDTMTFARDIDDLELMRVMGIDWDPRKPESLTMTAAGGDQSNGKEGENKEPVILSQEAATLAKACTSIQSQGQNFIFFGHVTQCLVGEAAAQRDLVELLDYYERNLELRLNAPLYIVKGGRAREMLEEGSGPEGGTVVKRLEAIEMDAQFESASLKRSVKDTLAQLTENGCTLVPALTLSDSSEGGGTSDGDSANENTGGQGGLQSGAGGGQSGGQAEAQDGGQEGGQRDSQEDSQEEGGGETGAKAIQTAGYAVFRDRRLTGFLTPEETRGANFLLDEIYDGILELDLPDGSRVAVQLLDSQCSWKPRFEGKHLTGLSVNLVAEGAIGEIMGSADPMDREALGEMEELAAEQIWRMVASVLKRSQEEETDFLHLERKIGLRRPDCWHNLQREWDQVFPELDWEVQVIMRLRWTYDVNQSLGGVEP